MKPVHKYIFSLFRVPNEEQRQIIDSVNGEYKQPNVSKRGLVAWSVLNVYDESPQIIFAFIFCLVVVVPFVIFNHMTA